jgi:hypothetical protein
MSKLQERFERLRDFHRDLGITGNYDFNPHSFDFYRGLEVAMAILEDRQPQFKEVPEEWIEDIVGGLQ